MESRMETYLNAAISGNTENLPQPISRIDYLLCDLIKTTNESTENINKMVTEKINEIVADAPEDLDTLKEISDAVNTLTEIVNELEDKVNNNSDVTVPLFDTSAFTSMSSMFYRCYLLTTVPLFDTSNVVEFGGSTISSNLNGMFGYCYSLKTIPAFNTSKAKYMSYMFTDCYSLISVPELDTRNVYMMYHMFYNCISLTTVSGLYMDKCASSDSSSTTITGGMFYGCRSLTNCYLYNIRYHLQVGSGTTYGHLLTLESLLHMIKELIKSSSSYKFTIGSANLEKLANIYVKTIDITDEMIAEDSLIESKLPFEVCESTDEGAMTINEYVTSKNWVLN